MRYVASSEVKEKGLAYEGIGDRIPWVIEDGTLDVLTQVHRLRERRDILDIGCGNGQTLQYFSGSAYTRAGIDLCNYLNIPDKEEIQFSAVDLNFEPLPYESNSKDLVFAFQVMEHLENPFFFMREVHRVLKDGGLFILSVPNPYTVSTKLRYLFTNNMRRWNRRNDHLLFLTEDVFRKTYGHHFDTQGMFYQKGLMPVIGRLYRFLGIRKTPGQLKILPRTKAFGDSMGWVLRKK